MVLYSACQNEQRKYGTEGGGEVGGSYSEEDGEVKPHQPAQIGKQLGYDGVGSDNLGSSKFYMPPNRGMLGCVAEIWMQETDGIRTALVIDNSNRVSMVSTRRSKY